MYANLPPSDGFEYKYYIHRELTAFLRDLEKNYSDVMKVDVIGKTYEGREIYCATITNPNKPANEKPAYYIDANIHAGEVTGSTVALYTIYYLLTSNSEDIQQLLTKFAFYIIPRISADGAERYLTTPHTLRSSTKPWPYEYKLPGFHPKDINNDGNILLMRVKDKLGDWKISKKDPRLMIKREIDEFGGDYYRIYPEGLIHEYSEYDPIKVANAFEGLDLNRNNPAHWEQEYKQSGAGPYPLSEPETRAIADFFRNHENICGATTFHTFSGAILRPYSFTDDMAFENHDLEVYEKIGKIGEKITGYPCLNVYKDFKYDRKSEILGGFDDWIFDHFGIFIYTTELWDMIKEAGIENRDIIKFLMYDRTEDEEVKLLAWNDKNLDGKGFVNWQVFNHPQLGKVEIGGWKFKFTWQNPPLQNNYLKNTAHANLKFLLTHASLSPLLEVSAHKIEQLSNSNHYRISIEISNVGFLPTYISQQALNRRVVKSNKIEIECTDCELLSGKKKFEFPHLEGRSNKLRASVFGGLSPEDQIYKYSFLVAKAGTVSITVITAKAGKYKLKINISEAIQ